MFEQRILTLEDQMERISVNLEVGEGTKSAMKYEFVGIFNPIEMA